MDIRFLFKCVSVCEVQHVLTVASIPVLFIPHITFFFFIIQCFIKLLLVLLFNIHMKVVQYFSVQVICFQSIVLHYIFSKDDWLAMLQEQHYALFFWKVHWNFHNLLLKFNSKTYLKEYNAGWHQMVLFWQNSLSLNAINGN